MSSTLCDVHKSAKADSSNICIAALIHDKTTMTTAPTILKNPDGLLLPRHIAFICDGNSRWSRKRTSHTSGRNQKMHTSNNDGHISRQHQQVAAGREEEEEKNSNNIINRGITSLARSMMGHIAGAKRVVSIINMLLSIMEEHQKQQQQRAQLSCDDERMTTDYSDNKYDIPKNYTMIQYCTLFAFSTENWSRPAYEINAIFALIERISRRYRSSNKFSAFHDGKVRFRLLGDIDDGRIPTSTREELYELVRSSNKACDDRIERRRSIIDEYDDTNDDIPTLTICLAINYGGRADILRAATEYAQSIINAASFPTHVTNTTTTTTPPTIDITDENEISKRLCTATIPNVDLIVRTGGECRLSNFFLWESAYAELYFCDTLWPDFDNVALYDALSWYSNRERRFGGR